MMLSKKIKIYAFILLVFNASMLILLGANFFVDYDLMFPWIIIMSVISFVNIIIFAMLYYYEYNRYREQQRSDKDNP